MIPHDELVCARCHPTQSECPHRVGRGSAYAACIAGPQAACTAGPPHSVCPVSATQKRLENNMYSEPEEFQEDLKLVWSNCYLYNGENSEVAALAKELEALTAQRMRDMPADAKGADSEQMKAMQKQLKQMQKQLQLQQQMQMLQQQMTMQQPAAMAPPAPNRRNSTGGGRRASLPPAYPMVPAAPHEELREARDMSFEEKQQLSAGINKLTSNNLTKVPPPPSPL